VKGHESDDVSTLYMLMASGQVDGGTNAISCNGRVGIKMIAGLHEKARIAICRHFLNAAAVSGWIDLGILSSSLLRDDPSVVRRAISWKAAQGGSSQRKRSNGKIEQIGCDQLTGEGTLDEFSGLGRGD
jgi:hypothetical protein